MPIKVAVVGATGYAGAELVRILAGHPEVELAILTSRQFEGVSFTRVYPAMSGVVDLICEKTDLGRICEVVDLVFTALPHQIPMTFVPELIERGKRVVDLSADFRFSDASIYEAHYQEHTAKSYLKESVYGLSEIYRDRIRGARLIGNPGCYPTSILLPLIPLLRQGIIATDSLIADSKSGVSGAGRSPSQTTHFCEVHESYKAYKVASHRHNPEIDEILTQEEGDPVHITFIPHLVPMSRGMLTTIYADLRSGKSADDTRACMEDFYMDHPFIRVSKKGEFPETRHVRGTNFCDIGIGTDAAAGRVILISAIDNLVKGAAGQAVQNMNIMFGFDEKEGLLNIPFPL